MNESSSQAGLASFEGTEQQRRERLARLVKPEQSDAPVSPDGLIESVPS